MDYFDFPLKSNHEKDPFDILGQGLDLTQTKKAPPSDTGDLLSAILSAPKSISTPKPQQNPSKKTNKDQEFQHQYLKRAQKPIKPVIEKPKLFTPKDQSKEAQYQQKITEAKKSYEIKNTQKRYKPKVFDYLGFGSKKQQKPSSSNYKNDNRQRTPERIKEESTKQRQNYKKSRKIEEQPQKKRNKQRERSKDRDRSRDREKEKRKSQNFSSKQKQSSMISERKRDEESKRRQMQRKDKQKERSQIRQKQREREREKEKQKERERQKQRQRQRQKQRNRAREKSRQDEKRRDRQQKQRPRQSQRDRHKQRQRNRDKQRHKKHRRYQNEDDYDDDDGFIVKDQEDERWQEEMQKITKSRQKQRLYHQRDKEPIFQSSAHQIMGEDIISARRGRQEEEEDWLREQQEKRRRMERKRREQERRKR